MSDAKGPPEPSTAIKAYSYLRFSTPDQRLGDSARRQLTATREYCVRHKPPLELDEELRDEGISARRGKHIRRGALGRFIQRVSKGQIPRGSFLIVEAFDRLSRQPIDEALEQFLTLTRSHITVVTLLDGKEYNRQSIRNNIGDLYASIGLMLGANIKSENKARRVRESWEARRHRITKIVPGWLRVSVDGTEYEPVPERVEVVRRIFRECQYHGLDKIVEGLNRDGIPPFETFNNKKRRTAGWHGASLRRMIVGRAVLGEIELHRYTTETRDEIIDGKRIEYAADVRISVGRRMKAYPPIIDENMWYASNTALASRVRKGGRKGAAFTNLFQGLAICGSCGGSMKLRTSFYKGKAYAYLYCWNARRAMCSNRRSVEYFPAESWVLRLVGEEAYGASEPQDDNIAQIMSELAVARKEAEAMETEYSRAFRAFTRAKAGSLADKNLSALEEEHSAKLSEIVELEKRLGVEKSAQPSSKQITAIKQLLAELNSQSSSEQYSVRAKIAAGLKDIVAAVRCQPNGDAEIWFKSRSGQPVEGRRRILRAVDNAAMLAEFQTKELRTAAEVIAALDAGKTVVITPPDVT